MHSLTHNPIPVCFLFSLLIGLQTSAAVNAQENPPPSDSHSQWVSDLADSNPQARRLAESKILDAGPDALPALELGARSFELEVSSRCNVLLEKIRLRERSRVSKLFLVKDAPVDPSLNLAAWPQFSAFIGSDELPARKLFLKICDSLPDTFKDYAIQCEPEAESLAKSAAAVIAKEKSSQANASASGIAFLFLCDLAMKVRGDDVSEGLFEKEEMVEFVDFFTTGDFARRAGRDSAKLFQRVVADWILQQRSAGLVSDPLLFRFVHETQNLVLLQQLKDEYESFDVSQKMKFLDVANSVPRKKNEWASLRVWLEDALADDTIAIRTRRKKNPSKEVVVSMRMLAEGMLANAIKQSLATGEPVKSEGVFGSFELSGSALLIVSDDNQQALLKEYLESDMTPE